MFFVVSQRGGQQVGWRERGRKREREREGEGEEKENDCFKLRAKCISFLIASM